MYLYGKPRQYGLEAKNGEIHQKTHTKDTTNNGNYPNFTHLYGVGSKGEEGQGRGRGSKRGLLLSKERLTRLGGSFGTEKEHCNLRKVKARTEETEILWILFGIHTTNAVRLAGRQQQGNMKKQYKNLRIKTGHWG